MRTVTNVIDMRLQVHNRSRVLMADPFYVPCVIISRNGVERIGLFTESPLSAAEDLALHHPEDVRDMRRPGYFGRVWRAICGH